MVVVCKVLSVGLKSCYKNSKELTYKIKLWF